MRLHGSGLEMLVFHPPPNFPSFATLHATLPPYSLTAVPLPCTDRLRARCRPLARSL